MLVLTRRTGQTIVIDGGICVTVLATRGNRVRLGITAPSSVRVDRAEVHDPWPVPVLASATSALASTPHGE
jgi:carbon storage regulator